MAAVATPLQSDGADDDHEEHDETMEDASDPDDDIAYDADGPPQSHTDNGQDAASPSEPTNYSLFSNPPDLKQMRERLFDISEPINMSLSDFEQYFPWVDNVWRKRKLEPEDMEPGSNHQIYWCRLRKAPGLKPHIPKPTPEGKTPRKKREKPDQTCNMALKVVYIDHPTKRVVLTRHVPEGEDHTHNLDFMDANKRNGAIMDVARREAVRSFLPTSIFWKMQQEPDKMDDAGGKSMKVSDVRNVQYAWRQEHPTAPLKAHSGFNTPRAGYTGRVPSKKFSPKQHKASPNNPPSQPVPSQPPHIPAHQSHPKPVPPSQAYQPSPQPFYPAQAPSAPLPSLPFDALQYPDHARTFLNPYLPDIRNIQLRQRPHITLTYASSLDGRIAIFPSQRTALSGPESKAMTHYLRSTHDAILIGVRTAIADDPSLNCRLANAAGYGAPAGSGTMQPRPVIIDPHARLRIDPGMAMLRAVSEGRAKAPWIVVSPTAQLHPVAVGILKAHGGEYLQIHDYNPQIGGFSWEGIFNVLYREGIKSIMVEGGGVILSELLKPIYAHLLDSVITTISAQYLGQQGVQVSQPSCVDANGRLVPTRLKDVRWQPIGEEDAVMCAHIKPSPPTQSNYFYPVQKELQGPQALPPPPPPPPQHHQGPPPPIGKPGAANGILEGIEEIANSAPPQTNGHGMQQQDQHTPRESGTPEAKRRKKDATAA